MPGTPSAVRVTEVEEAELGASPVDLFLVASGYEERASFAASRLSSLEVRKKVALAFTDRRHELCRPDNDRELIRLGFELVEASGASGAAAVNAITMAARECSDGACRVLVDYSCMTRVWYAAIVTYLSERAERHMVVDFLYAPSEFSPPAPARPNKYVEALEGFSALSSPEKPTALVIGLGYEADRALGLVNYIEPAVTVAFLSDPALDSRFVEVTEEANGPLLRILGEEQIVRYPLGSLRATAALLESCCLGLLKEHRIILAPLGPKPFALLSMLLATAHVGIEVWRVSAGEKGNVKSRKPLGTILCTEVEVEKEKGSGEGEGATQVLRTPRSKPGSSGTSPS